MLNDTKISKMKITSIIVSKIAIPPLASTLKQSRYGTTMDWYSIARSDNISHKVLKARSGYSIPQALFISLCAATIKRNLLNKKRCTEVDIAVIEVIFTFTAGQLV